MVTSGGGRFGLLVINYSFVDLYSAFITDCWFKFWSWDFGCPKLPTARQIWNKTLINFAMNQVDSFEYFKLH